MLEYAGDKSYYCYRKMYFKSNNYANNKIMKMVFIGLSVDCILIFIVVGH